MAKVYVKICDNCKRKFVARSANAVYCEDCRKKAKQIRIAKAKAKKPYYTRSKKSLYEIIREMEAYNREHNTHLTYGQYVLKIEGGQDDV